MQEFAAAFTSGKRQGYIELVFSRLCGILRFQDIRSLCGCRVPFVPGTRWGGVRKASTVWRQVATAGGPESSAARHALGCHDGDRLEAYPTVVVSRYLDCKIWELTEDLSLALDVIPQDKTIEIVAAGEEHPPLGLLGHAVRKTDVFLGL